MKQISEIRREISEIRKSEKIFGPTKKLVGHDAMLDYIQNNVKETSGLYGITMTEIPKVGINPRSEHETPIGIYFYPLYYYKDTLDDGDQLPFQHQAKFINLIKSKSSKPSVLSLTDIKESDKKDIINKIKSLPIFVKNKTFLKQLDNIVLDSKHNSLVNNPGGNLWYILMRTAQHLTNHSEKYFGTQSNRPVLWNWLLRKLGYDAVLDLDGGIIHHNEPTQGFFLSIKDFVVMKTIDNNVDKQDRMSNILKNIFSPEFTDQQFKTSIGNSLVYTFKHRFQMNELFYKRVLMAINKRSNLVKNEFVSYFPHSVIDVKGLTESDYKKIIGRAHEIKPIPPVVKKLVKTNGFSNFEAILLLAIWLEYDSKTDLLKEIISRNIKLSQELAEAIIEVAKLGADDDDLYKIKNTIKFYKFEN